MVNFLNSVTPTKIKPKGSSNLKTHIWIQISKYTGYGFRIVKIICDREGAFVHLIPDGNGSSHPSGKIDRRIRSIKESVRSLFAALPYQVPLCIVKYAVMFAVSRFNLFRHHPGWGDGVSPKELLSGVKTDFRRDCRVDFGEYCLSRQHNEHQGPLLHCSLSNRF